MMEYQKPPQPSLFYEFSLNERVPPDHPLRAIAAHVDFDFIYGEVEDLYGYEGKPSVPPPVILKLMFLLAYENVVSERRLMSSLPLRLDWLWFLGLDLDSRIPDHSVLSKARKRWGAAAFRRFFERIVGQAVTMGLIEGTRIFCDGSLFDANASKKSVVRMGVVDLGEISDELERRIASEEGDAAAAEVPVAVERRSTTDPDAAVVTKPNAGAARPRYKAHRAIDDRCGIITATEATPGNVDEGHKLEELIDQHEKLTDSEVGVVTADTQYGTTENCLMCLDRAIVPQMPLLAERSEGRDGHFTRHEFVYDQEANTYRCPQGKTLRPTQQRPDRNGVRYTAKAADCASCPLRARCTTGQARSITRHLRQGEIDAVLANLKRAPARRDLRRRKHFMERSFAVAVRYGFKRCRWRGMQCAEIHELLVATVQNVVVLVRNATQARKRAAAALAATATSLRSMALSIRKPLAAWSLRSTPVTLPS